MIIFQLSVYVSIPVLTEWIDIFDFIVFDNSICNKTDRRKYLEFIGLFSNNFNDYLNRAWSTIPLSPRVLQWCRVRNLKLKNVVLTNTCLSLISLDLNRFIALLSCVQGAIIYHLTETSRNILPVLLDSMMELEELQIHGMKDAVCQTPLLNLVDCLITRFPRLKRLSFLNCVTTNQSPFIEVVKSHPNLTELQLPGCASWSRDFFYALTVSAPNLTSLSVPYSINYRNAPFLMHPLPLIRKCSMPIFTYDLPLFLWSYGRTLEVLQLSHCPWVVDETLLTVAASCECLTSLDLTRCDEVSVEGLCAVLTSLPLLRVLILDKTIVGTSVVLNKLAEDCPLLEELYVHNKFNRNALPLDVKGLTKCSAIRTLTLINVGLTDHALQSLLRRCSHLTSLNISENPLLVTSYACEEAAPLFGKIQHLVLDQCHNLYFEFLSLLAEHCVRLKTLSLAGCRQVRHNHLMALITANRRLASLNISGCIFTAQDAFARLADLLRSTSISTLNLTGCNVYSQDIVLMVESLPKLRELLFSVHVTASSLLAINPDLQF